MPKKIQSIMDTKIQSVIDQLAHANAKDASLISGNIEIAIEEAANCDLSSALNLMMQTAEIIGELECSAISKFKEDPNIVSSRLSTLDALRDMIPAAIFAALNTNCTLAKV